MQGGGEAGGQVLDLGFGAGFLAGGIGTAFAHHGVFEGAGLGEVGGVLVAQGRDVGFQGGVVGLIGEQAGGGGGVAQQLRVELVIVHEAAGGGESTGQT